MIKYIILHPRNGVLNTECIRGQYEYAQVASLNARSLEEAFRMAQNDFNDDYAILGVRSTCIGDIIIDVRHEKHYFVDNVGFTEIPHTVSSYLDFTNHLIL